MYYVSWHVLKEIFDYETLAEYKEHYIRKGIALQVRRELKKEIRVIKVISPKN